MSRTARFVESLRFLPFLLKWYLLAFASGAVNVGAFLACSRFATHVTGFAAHLGINAAEREWGKALGMALVPVFFLGGAVLAALFVDLPVNRGLRPRHRAPIFLSAALVGVVGIGGVRGWFGAFGDVPDRWGDFVVLALLSAASGMQNALNTTISGGLVRTTHMTGTTTDIGIGIVRLVFPSSSLDRTEREFHRLWLRVGTVTAFVLGSLAGALLTSRAGFAGFLMPAGVMTFVGATYR